MRPDEMTGRKSGYTHKVTWLSAWYKEGNSPQGDRAHGQPWRKRYGLRDTNSCRKIRMRHSLPCLGLPEQPKRVYRTFRKLSINEYLLELEFYRTDWPAGCSIRATLGNVVYRSDAYVATIRNGPWQHENGRRTTWPGGRSCDRSWTRLCGARAGSTPRRPRRKYRATGPGPPYR